MTFQFVRYILRFYLFFFSTLRTKYLFTKHSYANGVIIGKNKKKKNTKQKQLTLN